MVSQLEVMPGSGGIGATYYKGEIDLSKIIEGGASYSLKVVHRVNEPDQDARIDFVKQLAAAILDQFFMASGRYDHRHIPQPIGLSEHIGLPEKNGSVYQFAEGHSRFPWRYPSGHMVILEEWIPFANIFRATGIGVYDCVYDLDNPDVSRNIIADYDIGRLTAELSFSPEWVRISFDRSCPTDWRTLGKYIEEHGGDIGNIVGTSMRDLLISAHQAGMGQKDPKDVAKMYHELLKSFGPPELNRIFAAPHSYATPGR